MPALGSHLASARLLADRLAHRDIEADRGSYYLGATAPDIRIITRGDREHTHFFTLDELENQDSVRRMLEAHPRLASPRDLDEATRAFMAGYLTHLLLDEHYIQRVYREYFGAGSLFKGDPRGDLLDRVLQYEMERREREQTDAMASIRDALTSSGGFADVEFIERETLRRWRDVAIDMASHPATWDRFVRVATRHLRDAPEGEHQAQQLMTEIPNLLREVIDHVTEERMREFMDRAIEESTQRVREYLQ
jgi:hypothetical protein